MHGHWFWWILVLAVMAWYSTVTVYVAIRGTMDIKQMLRRLRNGRETEKTAPRPPP